MNSAILEQLYEKYDIANLSFGKIHDKLGDVYEEYCIIVLQDIDNLNKAKNNIIDTSLEFSVFKSLLVIYDISNFGSIEKITATNVVPHRETVVYRRLISSQQFTTLIIANKNLLLVASNHLLRRLARRRDRTTR